MGRIVEEYDPGEDPMGSGAPFAEPRYPGPVYDPTLKGGRVPLLRNPNLGDYDEVEAAIKEEDERRRTGRRARLTSLTTGAVVYADDVKISGPPPDPEDDTPLGIVTSVSGGSATVAFTGTMSPGFVSTVYGVDPATADPSTRTVVSGSSTSAFRSGGGGPRFAPRLDTVQNELNFYRQFAAYLLEMVGGSIVLNDNELIELMEARRQIFMQDNMDKNTTTYKLLED